MSRWSQKSEAEKKTQFERTSKYPITMQGLQRHLVNIPMYKVKSYLIAWSERHKNNPDVDELCHLAIAAFPEYPNKEHVSLILQTMALGLAAGRRGIKPL